MSMNRRNVLVGLGTIVAGGGAALGTGAFSSVEASREVNIETDDDSDALLQIRANSEYSGEAGDYVDEDTDDEGTVSIDIGTGTDEGVNRDAVTTFEDLLEVENAGTQDVGFYIKTDDDLGEGEVLDFRANGSSIVGEGEAVDLDDANDGSETETITIKIDLTAADKDGDDIPEDVTLTADIGGHSNA